MKEGLSLAVIMQIEGVWLFSCSFSESSSSGIGGSYIEGRISISFLLLINDRYSEQR